MGGGWRSWRNQSGRGVWGEVGIGAGDALRRWGYRARKPLPTPWGLISGLRLPHLRDIEKYQEVAFLSAQRAESRLAELLLASTLGGMSYRKVVFWARQHLGMVISTARVGRVVEAAAERMERRW